MPDDYDIFDTCIIDDPSKDIKVIIKKYVENEFNYADPNICKNEHEIGKNYIPEENITLFWINLDKRYFFDVQKGNQ